MLSFRNEKIKKKRTQHQESAKCEGGQEATRPKKHVDCLYCYTYSEKSTEYIRGIYVSFRISHTIAALFSVYVG
jgi:hypothetical protein